MEIVNAFSASSAVIIACATETSSSAGGITAVSSMKSVAADALLPEVSVMSTATATFPSTNAPLETSTVQSPLSPADASLSLQCLRCLSA